MSWSSSVHMCKTHIQTLYTKVHAFMQTNQKAQTISYLSNSPPLLWHTADLSDKTEVRANTHSPHLADHFPLVLVCQKQQPRLSFHLNPKLTSKVWPGRALQCWELPVKLKESKQWTKFPLSQTLAIFSSTKSYITSQATWVHGSLNRSRIQLEVPST